VADISDVTHHEWMGLARLTGYADVSVRTLGEWIRHPTNPLPAYQVGRKILIRRSDFDAYVERHPLKSDLVLDEIIKDLV